MSAQKRESEKIKETQSRGKLIDETIVCSSCSMIFAKKDSGKHKVWCGSLSVAKSSSSLSDQLFPEKAQHGFIHQNRRVLFAPVVDDLETPKELRQLPPSRLRDMLIFMNPKSMFHLNLKLGDHVAVGSNSNEELRKTMVATAWPSSKVPVLSVGIPKTTCLVEKNSFASGKSFWCIGKLVSINRASKIRLISSYGSSKTFYQSESFHRVCSVYLNGTCVKDPEDLVRIPYFGQVCVMKAVASTVAGYSEEEAAEKSNISLCHQFSTLEMDDECEVVNGSEILASRTSTPIRQNENTPATPTSTPGQGADLRLPIIDEKCHFLRIDESTEITIEAASPQGNYRPKLRFTDLAGMARTKEIVYDHVAVCMKGNVDGAFAMKSILLYGSAGCGKSSLAEAVAGEFQANFIRMDVAYFGTSDDGNSNSDEKSPEIGNIFQIAEKNAPCIVLLDDIDQILEKGKKNASATVNLWLENLQTSSARICVIGTTNGIDRVNPQLRKRFQFEIEIPVPTAADRKLILQKMVSKLGGMGDSEVETLVDRTHGFTPADLQTLFKEAFVSGHKRTPPGDVVQLNMADFQTAFMYVRPSAMREIYVEIPKVRWSDVGGNEEVKLKLRQAIEWPLRYGEQLEYLGVKAHSGVLMYGPPGCSKTMIAKALATESGLNFLSVKGPELFSKWVGESEKAVRDLFRKARRVAPAVIFFDEIDAIGTERSGGGGSSNVNERVLAQMLTELDGIEPLTNVTVVAATNRPDVIDRALLRPGRFDFSIYVRLPDAKTREQILKLEFGRKRVSDDADVALLVERTEGYSGAELVALCNEAGLMALSESRMIKEIGKRHFEQALNVIRPRITEQALKVYEKFEKSVDT